MFGVRGSRALARPAVTIVDETWKGAAAKPGSAVGARHDKAWTAKDKQTWLLTNHVKEKVRGKKKQCHAFLVEKIVDNWQRFKIAKKEAKKVVAPEKAAPYANLNKKLESCGGKRYVYRLAKARYRQTEDIEMFIGRINENVLLLTNRKQVETMARALQNVSTVEFDHTAVPCTPPLRGPVKKIAVKETITL
nr:unnamed protein product [Haemonchus contortus]